MTDRFPVRFAVGLLALCGPAAGLTLELPGDATETAVRVERMTSYRMPVGPFAEGVIDTRLIEGSLDQRAWRFAAQGRSTLELLQPLRDQVTGAGFVVIFECEAVRCGGFDFRYGTDVLPEPDMHVDLGDFHYLAAERIDQRSSDAGPELVSLIVSRGVDQGFVQITQVGWAAPTAPDMLAAPTKPDIARRAGLDVLSASGSGAAVVTALPEAEQGTLADRLTNGGAQVLTDLVFDSGSAVLLQDAFVSLNELAAFLKDNPGVQVVLVGHTDTTGELGANIALSRERARSVRQRLLTEFDIPARQIDAEGVGYLSPRAPNDTEEGRVANRRVEVMLLSLGTE